MSLEWKLPYGEYHLDPEKMSREGKQNPPGTALSVLWCELLIVGYKNDKTKLFKLSTPGSDDYTPCNSSDNCKSVKFGRKQILRKYF